MGRSTGQVSGVGAFQNLVYKDRGAAPQVKQVWSVAHKAAGFTLGATSLNNSSRFPLKSGYGSAILG